MATELIARTGMINRELARNAGLRKYRPNQTQQKILHQKVRGCKAVKCPLKQWSTQIAEHIKFNPGWQNLTVNKTGFGSVALRN